jgi:hypothetical protein
MTKFKNSESPKESKFQPTDKDKKVKKINGHMVETQNQNEEKNSRTTFDGPGPNRTKVNGFWVDKKE